MAPHQQAAARSGWSRLLGDPLMGSERDVVERPEIINLSGRRVWLRPLEVGDRPLFEDLVQRTQAHDLRMRFFGGIRTLPPYVLDQLMLIDPKRRITLVAGSTARCGKPEMLAVASAYTLTESSAELALLVRSDLKGMGMGSMLLDRLIERCRRRRFSLIVADVLQENTRMLRLADKCGFRQKAAQLGTARLVLDLDLSFKKRVHGRSNPHRCVPPGASAAIDGVSKPMGAPPRPALRRSSKRHARLSTPSSPTH